MAWKDKSSRRHLDLEATETYIRHCMHQIGSIMLEEILNSDNGSFLGNTIPCKKCKKRKGNKPRNGYFMLFRKSPFLRFFISKKVSLPLVRRIPTKLY